MVKNLPSAYLYEAKTILDVSDIAPRDTATSPVDSLEDANIAHTHAPLWTKHQNPEHGVDEIR